MLNQTHPEYDADRLARFSALYNGGREWDALAVTWLPQHPGEMDELYKARISRALYENHAGPIVDLISGGLFSQPPTVTDFEYSWFADFSENVNREGTSLPVWFAEFITEALVGQRAYAWVNRPARPQDVQIETRADEEAAGLSDAFLVSLCAEHVIDWSRNEYGQLVWLVIRDVLEDRPDVGSERKKRYRWTYIDREVIRRWEWTPKTADAEPDDDTEADELPTIEHKAGELPVVELRLPSGLHAMGKLHDPAIAHTRGRNDLSWALHKGAHPLLWIRDPYLAGETPKLGPGYYLKVNRDGDVGYAEPSGTSFALLAEDVIELREAMYRVVQQMAIGAGSSASRSKMSGESKKMDWAALEVVLSKLSALLKPCIRNVLRMVATIRGDPNAKPSIGGLEGWQEADMSTWLVNAATALEAAKMSPTFRKQVAKRQARGLLTDADEKVMAEIDAEIDSAKTDDPSPYLPPPPAPPPDKKKPPEG